MALDFLVNLHDNDYSYNSINTARSAISTINNTYANESTINRFLKGIFNIKPALPKHTVTWDVKVAFDHLQSILLCDISVNLLSRKLVFMLLLLSGQRLQTVHSFSVDNVCLEDTRCIFYVNKLMKTSRPGKHQSNVTFVCYDNPDLCVVCHIKKYLLLTNSRRIGINDKSFFLTTCKPYKSASIDTLSRWSKDMLTRCGIDVKVFQTHSTRGASTSKALAVGIPVHEIMSSANWSNAHTFARFYNKPIQDSADNFGHKLLTGVFSSNSNG